MYDILIKNGTIYDGTGKKDGFVADIGISGAYIKKIGNLKSVSAKKVIDATGFFVCPGFIDVLNHSDTYLTLFTTPKQNSLISQGITTIIGGNCGSSLAPLVSGEAIESVQKWTDTSQINVNWLRMSEFLGFLENSGKLALNFGTLTGYGTIRRGVLKEEHRKSSKQEVEMCKFLLDQSQKDGSFGMSSGLLYSSEKDVDSNELTEVLKTIKIHNNIFCVHLRNEADKFLESVTEVLSIAKKSGVKIHFSHLKVLGQENWGKFEEALEKISEAKITGTDVSFDVFPYASNGIVLYTLLRRWAKEGGHKKILERLNDKRDRDRIINDLREMNLNYKKMTVASFISNKSSLGKTLYELSIELNISPEEVIVYLLLSSNLKVIVFAHIMSESNLQKAIMHPLSIIASDGAGYDLDYKKNGDMPHPRAFGAFSRFLRKYPNPAKENIISYKDAIHKITGFPAERFNINKRGKIKSDYFADITIFDPNKIEELTTFEYPYKYSIGIKNVIINGRLSYEEEIFSNNFFGKIIKR